MHCIKELYKTFNKVIQNWDNIESSDLFFYEFKLVFFFFTQANKICTKEKVDKEALPSTN